MSELFDYPPNGWISHSNFDVAIIAPEMHKGLTRLGANVHLLNASSLAVLGWDKCIQGAGFNIKFIETDYGVDLHIYVFDENKDGLLFLYYWKWLVDENQVWGGPYKKPLMTEIPSKETEQEKLYTKTKVELTYFEKQTVSDQAKTIILKAFELERAKPPKKRESAERFVKHSLSYIANMVSAEIPLAYSKTVFEAEMKVRDLSYPLEDVTLESLCSAANLRLWYKDRVNQK